MKRILFSVVFLLFAYSVVGESYYPVYQVCYQEFSNRTGDNCGVSSGRYWYEGENVNLMNMTDGDWDTRSGAEAFVNQIVNINYTIGSLKNKVLWAFKDDRTGIGNNFYNISLNLSENKCSLVNHKFLFGMYMGNDHVVHFGCYNGSGYSDLIKEDADSYVWEEALFQNLSVGNISYEEPMGEGVNEIVFMFNNESLGGSSVILYYNGVTYPGVPSTVNNRTNFTATVPYITNGTFSFYWNYSINYSINENESEYVYGNTSSMGLVQAITESTISNCSGGNVTLNFSVKMENYPFEPLNSSFEIEIIYWTNFTQKKYFNKTIEPNSNFLICISSITEEMYADIYAKYSQAGGFTHRYYSNNVTLSNDSKRIDLYNYNFTSGLCLARMTLRNYNDYTYLPNIYAEMERKYTGDGLWRPVQWDRSADTGLVTFDVYELTQDYRTRFYSYPNNTLKQTNQMKFTCTSGVTDITFIVNPSGEVEEVTYINAYSQFDNVTKNLSVSWVDPMSSSPLVRGFMIKNTNSSNFTICDQSEVANTGTFSCDVTGWDGEIKIVLLQNGTIRFTDWVGVGAEKLGGVLALMESAMSAFVVLLTVIGFGIAIGPVAAVLAAIAGIVFVYQFSFMGWITMAVIIILSFIGVIVSVAVREK